MNERGKGALINAQLRGVRQIKGRLFDGEGGMCAGGVLCVEAGMYDQVGRWVKGFTNRRDSPGAVAGLFALDRSEWEEMVNMNNVLGYDFIKIARELPDSIPA